MGKRNQDWRLEVKRWLIGSLKDYEWNGILKILYIIIKVILFNLTIFLKKLGCLSAPPSAPSNWWSFNNNFVQ
jgi:ABC-type enterobactin transport system permease subunit